MEGINALIVIFKLAFWISGSLVLRQIRTQNWKSHIIIRRTNEFACLRIVTNHLRVFKVLNWFVLRSLVIWEPTLWLLADFVVDVVNSWFSQERIGQKHIKGFVQLFLREYSAKINRRGIHSQRVLDSGGHVYHMRLKGRESGRAGDDDTHGASAERDSCQ
jgi:hypothetical protein